MKHASALFVVGLGLILGGGPATLYASEVREFVVGPIQLDSYQVVDLPMRELPVVFGEDLWVLGMESRMEDGEGNQLPGHLLCHTIFLDEGRDASTDTTIVVELGLGPDSSPLVLPAGSGVPLQAGRSYVWQTMFQNPYDQAFPEVYLRLKLLVEPQRGQQTVDRPLQQACAFTDGMVPPGQSTLQREVQFLVGGRVVYMFAHLHRYGQRFSIERLDDAEGQAPRLAWEAVPMPSETGEFRMPSWVPGENWYVTPEDRFRLSADYDNTGSEPWPAMGALCMFFER